MDKALFLQDVYLRSEGRQIFSELSLEARRGEILAVCGTGASHMQYLVPLLTRTVPEPYSLSGILRVDGAETERLSEEEMRFARMMNIAVLPGCDDTKDLHIPVSKYITLPFKESVKKSVHEIITDTRRIIQLLGVTNPDRIMRKNISSLSLKDLRAVLYATALATDPAVAIVHADAPDMSPTESDELFTLLIKVCKIKNIALILLTSDVVFAKKYGEQVFLSKHDRILPLEGAAHPHLSFLESAAKMQTLSLPEPRENVLVTASNAVFARGMQSLDFSLHEGELLAFSCDKGISVFTGKKGLVSGSLTMQGTPFKKNKAFLKKTLPIYGNMPLPPVETVDEAMDAFAIRPSQRLSKEQLYTSLGLMPDFGKLPLSKCNLFDTLRLGLLLGAISEARLLLLTNLEQLDSAADRYEILTLLSAVIEKTGAGALVFSNNTDVLHAVGTRFYKEPNLEAVKIQEETEVTV